MWTVAWWVDVLKSNVNKGWVLAIAMVLVLPALACITIEFGSPGKTPEPTVVAYRTPPISPTSLRPTVTPTQPPIATPTSPAPLRPSVSEVFFAARVTGASEPVDVATEFPEGTTTVYAFASYAGMLNGTQCESVWYRDGEEAARTAFAWALGDSGETWMDFTQRDGGLPVGRYNWELHVEGELIAGGVFVVGVPGAETPTRSPLATPTPVPPSPTSVPPTPTRGPTEFDPIIFAKGLTEEVDPIFPTTTFPPGTTEVYAVWACRGMYPGLELFNRWYHNGQEYAAGSVFWEREAERGRWWLHLYRASGAPLPSGNYRLELHVHGRLLQSETFVIQ